MIAKIIDEQRLVVCDLTQFDIVSILHSGQVFRYFPTANGWLVLSGTHWAEIRVLPEQAEIKCDNAEYFYQYFDLDTDYQSIKSALNFPKLRNAIQIGGGIRILHADFIETVISFIISANNNIKRFTKTINQLCCQFGSPIANGQFAFPTLSQLTQITVADFQALGCGYRAPYLVKAIQQLQNLDFQVLSALPTSSLRQTLISLAGVGPKVAACIMLFAFHRLEAVPVDTWIKKALSQLSADEQKTILSGPYAGVAQQYIFYYLQYLHKENL